MRDEGKLTTNANLSSLNYNREILQQGHILNFNGYKYFWIGGSASIFPRLCLSLSCLCEVPFQITTGVLDRDLFAAILNLFQVVLACLGIKPLDQFTIYGQLSHKSSSNLLRLLTKLNLWSTFTIKWISMTRKKLAVLLNYSSILVCILIAASISRN